MHLGGGGAIDLPERRVKTKINFAATHVLQVACIEQSLDDKISMMWDLDSVDDKISNHRSCIISGEHYTRGEWLITF